MKFLAITMIVHRPDPITGLQKPTHDRFREVLDNALLAEELGFDGFGVGERHERPATAEHSRRLLCARRRSLADAAIQVHGAAGLGPDTALPALFRTGRAARILDGPDELHITSVARRVLRTTPGSSAGVGRNDTRVPARCCVMDHNGWIESDSRGFSVPSRDA